MKLLAQMIIKLFLLDDENKFLKNELRARRTQADRWRKKCRKLERGAPETFDQKKVLALLERQHRNLQQKGKDNG